MTLITVMLNMNLLTVMLIGHDINYSNVKYELTYS